MRPNGLNFRPFDRRLRFPLAQAVRFGCNPSFMAPCPPGALMRGFRLLALLLAVLTLFAAMPMHAVLADPDVIIRFGSTSTDGKTVDSSNALRSTELQVISERA